MRNFYSNLTEANSNNHGMKNACEFAKHCLEKLENSDFEDGVVRKSVVLLVVVAKHVL